MKIKKIIVTGAGGPAGVNFINSLRAAPEKLHIIALDSNPFHLEWAQADEKFVMEKSENEKGYVKRLKEIIKKTKADLVHAQPDNEVRIIAENKKSLGAKTFFPSLETIDICQDKYQSSVKWGQAGIPILNAIYIDGDKSFKEAEKIFGYPYWLRASQGNSSRGSTPVPNLQAAKSWISYWRSRGVDWKFIAQEILPGRNIAFQSLWNKGELVTSQARERIEYIYPQLAPSGVTNTPVIAKTVHDEKINEMAQKAILSIDKKATGIFCVDMKENKNGVPIPTEINCGRFFTTSFFFTKAGINMPYYYVKLGFGEKIPQLPKLNAVPENWYWARHIDCPAILIKSPSYA